MIRLVQAAAGAGCVNKNYDTVIKFNVNMNGMHPKIFINRLEN